nr:polymerase [Papaya sticky fruit-associated virus]
MVEPLPREIYSALPIGLIRLIDNFIYYENREILKHLNDKLQAMKVALSDSSSIKLKYKLFKKPEGRLGGKTHLLLQDFLNLYNIKYSKLPNTEEIEMVTRAGVKEDDIQIEVFIEKNLLINNFTTCNLKALVDGPEAKSNLVLLSSLLYLVLFGLSNNLDITWNSINVCGIFILPFSSPIGYVPFVYSILEELWAKDILSASKRCKVFHNSIRVGGFIPLEDIVQVNHESFQIFFKDAKTLTTEGIRMLYGLDSILGPSEHYKFDPIGEVVARQVTPNKEITIKRDKSIYPNSYASFEEMKKDRLKSLDQDMFNCIHFAIVKKTHRPFKTFREWYKIRFSWAAAGGCPGAKAVWSQDEKIRVNKRGALLSVTIDEVVQAINSSYTNPVHYSKAAMKYEKGKNRAIWNTSLLMYIAQSYILYIFESLLDPIEHDKSFPLNQFSSWNASTANADLRFISNRERLSSLSINKGLMFDYSDFNINHSIFVQNRLYDNLTKVLSKKIRSNLHTDYSQVLKDIYWLNEYVMRAKAFTVLDSGNHDPYVAQAIRSLETGERGTSFVNTFLSNTYIRNVNRTSQELFDRQLFIENLWLQGDDVFGLTKTVADGVLATNLFNCLGYAGQPFKIGLSFANSGEFLRLSYDPQLHRIGGYPIRTTAGIISGEFFRDSIYDPDVRAGCYLTAVTRCNIRGAILSKKFTQLLISRNCKLVYTPDPNNKDRKVVMKGDPIFSLLPSLLGGFGTNMYLDSGLQHQVLGSGEVLNRLNLSPTVYNEGWFCSKLPNLNVPCQFVQVGHLFWLMKRTDTLGNVVQPYQYRLLKCNKNSPTFRVEDIPDVMKNKNIPDYFSAYQINHRHSVSKQITNNVIKSGVMGALPKTFLTNKISDYCLEHIKFRRELEVSWITHNSLLTNSSVEINIIRDVIDNFIHFLKFNKFESMKKTIGLTSSYGELPTLFIQFGFSLQENFEIMLNSLTIGEIFNLIIHNQHKTQIISNFINKIYSLNMLNREVFIKWITGKILLFPPSFELFDVDLISILRNWSLFVIETYLLKGMNFQELDIPYLLIEIELKLFKTLIKETNEIKEGLLQELQVRS